jgi:Asp-tRNA(Asn)/Glu-tRNA(Gln) amidotransferase A subunit family amidase
MPTVGVKCYSWALDTVGLFAATTADLAHALALVAERPGIALPPTPPGSLRIGVVTQDFAQAPDDAGLAALERAARAAEGAGAQVTRASLPDALADAWRKHGVIQDYEARHSLAWEYAAHRDQLPPNLRRQLDGAQAIEAAAYDDARRTAKHARRVLKDLFGPQGFDVLLTLSAPGRAPRGLASTGDARFNRLWTLMGVPCVNVPVPGDGLPLGVQVVARFGQDGEALAAAHFVETALARG